jgi:uncharacterized protein (TIGR00369 family)
MTEFQPGRPDYREAVRELHDRMPFAKQLGMVLDRIEPGRVTGQVARHLELMQQHGALHAGAIIGLADQMAGLAAYTLMSPGQEIVSVNFSVQLLRRADSDIIHAEGWVIKPGERFIFTGARVYGEQAGEVKDFANILITMAVR